MINPSAGLHLPAVSTHLARRLFHMDIRLTTQAVNEVNCDALVVGVARAKNEAGEARVALSEAARSLDGLLGGQISAASADGEIKGNLGELTTFHSAGRLPAKRVLVVGL